MLYDTSTCIDYLNAKPAVLPYFSNLSTGPGSKYYSAITEAELWVGIRDVNDEIRIAEVLSRFALVSVDGRIARLAGELLKGRSKPEIRAHFGDALIVASAIPQEETVLTADAASQRVFGHRTDYFVYR